MDQPRIWKSRGHRESLNFPFKYTPFGLSESPLGELQIVGFEEAVEKIVKEICKCQLKPLVDLSVEKKQSLNTCQQEAYPQIVCWTCKGLGHYSKDCELNKLKTKVKSVERWKSKVSTRTIGVQTDFLGVNHS